MGSSAASRNIIDRLERETGVADWVSLLTTHLSPSELTSLLLEVYQRQAATRTSADVLTNYERDRFSKPSRAVFRQLVRFEQVMLDYLPEDFEPITLSPVCPLGTCSVVAGVNQNWSVATSRHSEVVSDATNVLALEIASRRRALSRQDSRSQQRVHLATHHRLLRPQFFSDPRQVPHFALLALVSGGRAASGSSTELAMIELHLRTQLSILHAFAGSALELRVTISDFSGRDRAHAVNEAILEPLRTQFEDVVFETDPTRAAGRGYYSGVVFQIHGQHEHQTLFLVDGGEVNWSQKLLSNAKERMVISGLGSERLCMMASSRQ